MTAKPMQDHHSISFIIVAPPRMLHTCLACRVESTTTNAPGPMHMQASRARTITIAIASFSLLVNKMLDARLRRHRAGKITCLMLFVRERSAAFNVASVLPLAVPANNISLWLVFHLFTPSRC